MRKQFEDFIQHLNRLDKNDKPLWGKMTPQQMVEHLILTMKMSTGKIYVPLISDEKKLPVLKKILMSNRPLPKGFVNPAIGESLQSLEYQNLTEAIKALAGEIQNYFLFFRGDDTKKTLNSTFGLLNKSEWDAFHTKHFTHHLKQFSLLH